MEGYGPSPALLPPARLMMCKMCNETEQDDSETDRWVGSSFVLSLGDMTSWCHLRAALFSMQMSEKKHHHSSEKCKPDPCEWF